VLHRDLKPGNILLSDVADCNVVKLADFGISTRLKKNKQDEQDGIGQEQHVDGDGFELTTNCGTPAFMAPELVSDSRHVSVSKMGDSEAAVKAAVAEKLADLRALVGQGLLKQEAYDHLFRLQTEQMSSNLKSANSCSTSSSGNTQGSSSRNKSSSSRNKSTGRCSNTDKQTQQDNDQTFARASKVDTYSYGILFYALTTGNRPYIDTPAKNATHLMQQVVDGARPNIPTIGMVPETGITGGDGRRWAEASYPPVLRQILENCWHPNPDQRPSMSELQKMLKDKKVLEALKWQPTAWTKAPVPKVRVPKGKSAATSLALQQLEKAPHSAKQKPSWDASKTKSPSERRALHCPKRISTLAPQRSSATTLVSPACASVITKAPSTISEAEEERISEMFSLFASRNEMSGAKFAKFMRDKKLVNSKLSSTDIDLIFAKVTPKRVRKLDYEHFRHVALPMAAEKRGSELDKMLKHILKTGGAPVINRTKVRTRHELLHAPTATVTQTATTCHVGQAP